MSEIVRKRYSGIHGENGGSEANGQGQLRFGVALGVGMVHGSAVTFT